MEDFKSIHIKHLRLAQSLKRTIDLWDPNLLLSWLYNWTSNGQNVFQIMIYWILTIGSPSAYVTLLESLILWLWIIIDNSDSATEDKNHDIMNKPHKLEIQMQTIDFQRRIELVEDMCQTLKMLKGRYFGGYFYGLCVCVCVLE